jgi:membrane protease YdiL (CAAX protease family)
MRNKPVAAWPVFVGFVVAVFMMIAANGALFAIAALFLRARPGALETFVTSLAGISLSAGVTVVTLSSVAVVGATLSGDGILPRLRLGRGRAPASAIACAAFASSGASVAFGIAIELLHLQEGGVLAEISNAVVHSSLPLFFVSLFALAVLPALGEELFFRGFVQTRLEERWGRWPAIASTALLFGLIHFDLKQGAFAAFAGLLLGYVASRGGSIRAAMFVHCTNNAGSLILARIGLGPATTTGKIAVLAGALALLVLGVIGFVVQTRRGGTHSRSVA